MVCSADSEYFGADFRLGAYLPMFPPARLTNMRDAVLPVLSDGRILLDGRAWEMPTPQNIDVFFDRLRRADLMVFDPLIDELRHGVVRTMPKRTVQSRFVRAVGLPLRTLELIERARRAVRMLHAGKTIAEVATEAGYYDQPHLTRSLRQLIGHTPAEVANGSVVLGL
ncbi:helix-turn-helix domain-containing protein [Kribbella sp. NPDC050281]|uniref:helix-turn-helix domain-containing protein n=1 Tax=Kribbella sp. NPDC050281 TaxID=3155515 RepID=UPI0033F5053B